jgi:hypothetical protein
LLGLRERGSQATYNNNRLTKGELRDPRKDFHELPCVVVDESFLEVGSQWR